MIPNVVLHDTVGSSSSQREIQPEDFLPPNPLKKYPQAYLGFSLAHSFDEISQTVQVCILVVWMMLELLLSGGPVEGLSTA